MGTICFLFLYSIFTRLLDNLHSYHSLRMFLYYLHFVQIQIWIIEKGTSTQFQGAAIFPCQISKKKKN